MKTQKNLALKEVRSFHHGCQVYTWVGPVEKGLNLQPGLLEVFSIHGDSHFVSISLSDNQNENSSNSPFLLSSYAREQTHQPHPPLHRPVPYP